MKLAARAFPDTKAAQRILVVVRNGLDADGRGDMGLSRARATNENDVVGVIKEVAAVELADQHLVDLTAGKVEAVEIAIGRKACRLQLIGN